MILAKELQALGNSLGALAATKINSRVELVNWYAKAHEVRSQITSNKELSNIIPDYVWHYLSDADVRLKDERVLIAQNAQIVNFIEKLKIGRIL